MADFSAPGLLAPQSPSSQAWYIQIFHSAHNPPMPHQGKPCGNDCGLRHHCRDPNTFCWDMKTCAAKSGGNHSGAATSLLLVRPIYSLFPRAGSNGTLSVLMQTGHASKWGHVHTMPSLIGTVPGDTLREYWFSRTSFWSLFPLGYANMEMVRAAEELLFHQLFYRAPSTPPHLPQAPPTLSPARNMDSWFTFTSNSYN